MKRYIGYFDLMGYKNFIENNDSEETKKRVGHVLRDIEAALGQGEYKEARSGVLHADLSASKLQCITISDTIIFWTLDDSLESLNEILKVCFDFNFRLNTYNFPVRGALVFEEVEMITGFQRNNNGGTYSVNTIYGKGLVKAHIKAESQYWAGTVIDASVIEKIAEENNVTELLADYAMQTQVPYKKGIPDHKPEYALKLCKGQLNEEAFSNWKKGIEDVFAADKKGMDEGTKIKLENTIAFLIEHKETKA